MNRVGRSVSHMVQVNAGCTYGKPASSCFSNAAIESMLTQSPNSPPTGLVIVEIYRLHKQFLGIDSAGHAVSAASKS